MTSAGACKLRRGEVENRLHAGSHDPIDDALRFLARNREHDDVRLVALDVALEMRDVADLDPLERSSDLVRIVVVRGEDVKPRWRKPRYWARAAPIFPAPTITTRHSRPSPRISRSRPASSGTE